MRFLPRVAKDEIGAFLLTEPDVGSDPARMSATATPADDGSAFVRDGVFVADAQRLHHRRELL